MHVGLSSKSLVLQHLRWRQVRNTLSGLLKGSTLRVFTIFFVSLLVWSFVFGVSLEGLLFLRGRGLPLGGAIVGALFDLLFLTLTAGLIASTGIILYSSLFSSDETAFLLSTPAPADQVFAYKFQGAIAFSSWGFLLLGSPVLIAYGLAYGVAWYYYALLLLFFSGFVLLPGSLGALICFFMVNFLPRRRKQILITAGVAVLAGIGLWFWQLRPATWTDALNRDFVQHLLDQFSFARGPLSPNHWMTKGLQAAAQGQLGRSLYYLALVWSNGLFFYLVTAWTAARLYRPGFNRVSTGGTIRRRYGGHWLDAVLSRLVGFLNPQTRLLIVKDFRTFRRDPTQWAQVLIFTCLMILYFAAMRQFYQEEFSRESQNGISLMNLAATALLMCAYTGRFIYPMLSLEGRKFWVLGLLPLKRDRLLWGKFAFSATWALLVAEFLVIFSDIMLGMPELATILHALIVLVLALGLSGLSVGLGAWMPNFKETDPSKIAVGFGGTLNLVAGLLFLLLVLVATAMPLHLLLAMGQVSGEGHDRPKIISLLFWWLAIGLPTGIALGSAAVILPLRLGRQALRRMEF